MENFSCLICLSSESIQLECGHIQCRPCSLVLNLTNIQCNFCMILPVSNEDIGVINVKKLCNDCGKNFDSIVHYEGHKKKERCSLEKYGCTQQIDSCSMDKHLYDENHISAVKLYVNSSLISPINFNLVKVLTEFICENNNATIKTIENDQLESFDKLLALDFGAKSTINEIVYDDNNYLTDQERRNVLENQLIRGQQLENFLQSQISHLDGQLNNDQQENIPEEQIIISTMQNQIKICYLCKEEYNVLSSHICRKSEREFQEQINKLSLEIKKEEETRKQLIHVNHFLNINNNILETAFSNVLQSKNGLFIWLIKDIEQEIDISYSRRKSSIDSPKFSSLTGEHPLNVRLFLHGDLSVYPKYISIYVILSPGGNNNLKSIPLTCCLVDQTNNNQHIIRQDHVNLNQNQIGIICRFPQFIEAIHVHKQDSPFVENNTLCLIVKLHENQSNQYNHYTISIQNALQQINSLTFS